MAWPGSYQSVTHSGYEIISNWTTCINLLSTHMQHPNGTQLKRLDKCKNSEFVVTELNQKYQVNNIRNANVNMCKHVVRRKFGCHQKLSVALGFWFMSKYNSGSHGHAIEA
jgi:hypothetical protein